MGVDKILFITKRIEKFLKIQIRNSAFLLADAGFDVFLINHRGGTYSKRHVSLKPWQNKFWQWTWATFTNLFKLINFPLRALGRCFPVHHHFSIDEMAKYDCPAAIDKVLELSGKEKTYWIGHSMGTALGYGTIATNPEYNNKVIFWKVVWKKFFSEKCRRPSLRNEKRFSGR